MASGLFDAVASLAVWSLLVMTCLQVYVAYLLLARRPWGTARASLAALFVLNGLYTALTLVVTLDPSVAVDEARHLTDRATNGLMVIAAESAALAILGVRGSRASWAGPLTLAALLTFGLFVLPIPGMSDTPAYTLLAYGFVGVRLGHAGLMAPLQGESRVWAGWLLLAFLPRSVEFLLGFAWLPDPTVAAPLVSGLHLLGLGLIAVSLLLGGVLAARLHPSSLSVALGMALGAGLLIGLTRVVGDVNELAVVFFSLGIIRPVGIMAGIARGGLLDTPWSWPRGVRHGIIAVGAIVGFLGALVASSALLEQPDPSAQAFLGAAAALLLLPVWAAIAEGLVRLIHAPPRLGGGPSTTGEGGLPLGLDRACSYEPEHLAHYHAARAAVAALPMERRKALAALPRPSRLLLALRGSSEATRGRPRFSQAGVQATTHIPYRHIAAVVRAVNASPTPPGVLVRAYQGPSNVRYYHLTDAGAKAAEDLAARLGLGPAEEGRLLLGEAFYKEAEGVEDAAKQVGHASAPG